MSDTRENEISVRELRKTLAGVLNDVAVRGKVVYVTNHGRRIAALVPVTIAESLEQSRAAD